MSRMSLPSLTSETSETSETPFFFLTFSGPFPLKTRLQKMGSVHGVLRLRCGLRQGRGSWDREVLPAGWRCRWTSNSAQLGAYDALFWVQDPSRTQSQKSLTLLFYSFSSFTVIHFQILSICSVGSVVFANPNAEALWSCLANIVSRCPQCCAEACAFASWCW